jgi:hypothetical protein
MHITSIVHMSFPSALREQKALSVHSLRSGDNRAVCQFRAEVELGTHSRATIFCGQFHQIYRELKGKNDLKTTLLYYSPFVPLPFVHKVLITQHFTVYIPQDGLFIIHLGAWTLGNQLQPFSFSVDSSAKC